MAPKGEPSSQRADQALRPIREIRAVFDDETVVVYQAFSPEIAEPALAAGRFVPPFKLSRMTWIKPSFLWMMYRSRWATKPGQERVLAITLSRVGFEWALANSVLSHHDPVVYSSPAEWSQRSKTAPVRVQWDPERSLQLEQLRYRTIQIGLAGEAARRYAHSWTLEIADITPLVHEIHALVMADNLSAADGPLPVERPYPLPESIQAAIGATSKSR
jgi:hypothetical protein